jgi:hypothetical protein
VRGGWHVKTQTPIMLGGRAEVKCISPMWRPAGADGGVVLDETFSSDWRNRGFVGVKNPLTSLPADLLGSRCEKQRKFSVSSSCCKICPTVGGGSSCQP